MLWVIVVLVIVALLLLSRLLTKTEETVSYERESIYSSEKDAQEAVEKYSNLLAHNPRDTRAMVHLGNAYYRLGNLEEAAKYFVRALSLDQNLPEAHCGQGFVERARQNLDAAEECFRKALDRRPAYALALYGMGLVKYDRGDGPAALDYVKRALRINPKVVSEEEAEQLLESLQYLEERRKQSQKE